MNNHVQEDGIQLKNLPSQVPNLDVTAYWEPTRNSPTVDAAPRVLLPVGLALALALVLLIPGQEEPADRLCTPEINSQTCS